MERLELWDGSDGMRRWYFSRNGDWATVFHSRGEDKAPWIRSIVFSADELKDWKESKSSGSDMMDAASPGGRRMTMHLTF